jgi:hypothetical protein
LEQWRSRVHGDKDSLVAVASNRMPTRFELTPIKIPNMMMEIVLSPVPIATPEESRIGFIPKDIGAT